MRGSLFFVCLLFGLAVALDNGLARTPQMGFNSWNYYYCNVNETHMANAMDDIVNLGLDKLGYNYVVVDDCWALRERDAQGNMQTDPKSFPHGMKVLADRASQSFAAHSKGLKFGLYSSAGYTTCAGRAASLGHEKQDAKLWASWGVDYLKYDNCDRGDVPAKKRYGDMRDALAATGRTIFYSICSWGTDGVAQWGAQYGNSWRTTDDIYNGQDAVTYNIVANDVDAEYAAPGGWNDPDMLRIGNGGQPIGLDRIQFGLWSLAKAPLILSCDLLKLSQKQLDVIRNTEVIAVNQDALGVQGRLVYDSPNQYQIWAGKQSNGDQVVAVVNLQSAGATLRLPFNLLKFAPSAQLKIRSLWDHSDLGIFSEGLDVKVAGRDCVMLRLTPVIDVSDKIFRLQPKGLPGGMRPSDQNNVNGNVETGSWNSEARMKWKVLDAGDGYVYLVEQKNGFYLDLQGGQTAVETSATTFTFTGHDSTKWKIVASPEPNYYKIINKASGFVLDSYKCNEVGENPGGFAGGFIKTWYDVNTPCQQWLFVPV